jgi:hypothetical protein
MKEIGMTIQEAIQSGKPFRRKMNNKFFQAWNQPEWMTFSFSVEDILATDWELKEEKIELTRDQVVHALDVMQVFTDNVSSRYTGYLAPSSLNMILVRLGFKHEL